MVRHQNLRGSVTISPLQAILQSILDILHNHNLINQQFTNEYSIWIPMTIQLKSKKHSIIIPQREYKTTNFCSDFVTYLHRSAFLKLS